MNPIDDQLNRLFRAAGQARPDPVFAPAFGLETRVMAAWRAAQSVESAVGAGFWDMTLLVRGLMLASLIMAVSFLPALTNADASTTTTNPFTEFLQQTDSTISSDDAP
jgi:hypothetical protein